MSPACPSTRPATASSGREEPQGTRTDGQVGSVPMEARVWGAEHETVVKDLPVELCDGAWRFVLLTSCSG